MAKWKNAGWQQEKNLPTIYAAMVLVCLCLFLAYWSGADYTFWVFRKPEMYRSIVRSVSAARRYPQEFLR